MTQATTGVPIRVVAVAAFDPATIDAGTTSLHADQSVASRWIAWQSLGDRPGWSFSIASRGAEPLTATQVGRRVRGPAICRCAWLEASDPLVLWRQSPSRIRTPRCRRSTMWNRPDRAAARRVADLLASLPPARCGQTAGRTDARGSVAGRHASQPVRRPGSESGPAHGFQRPGSLW